MGVLSAEMVHTAKENIVIYADAPL